MCVAAVLPIARKPFTSSHEIHAAGNTLHGLLLPFPCATVTKAYSVAIGTLKKHMPFVPHFCTLLVSSSQ